MPCAHEVRRMSLAAATRETAGPQPAGATRDAQAGALPLSEPMGTRESLPELSSG